MSRDFPFMLSLSKHSESFFSNLLKLQRTLREQLCDFCFF